MIGSPAIILITDIPGAGKTTVAAALDDIVMGPWLDIHREAFAGLPWRLVVLVPDIDAVKARNAGRDKDIFDTWGYLDTALRAAMQGPSASGSTAPPRLSTRPWTRSYSGSAPLILRNQRTRHLLPAKTDDSRHTLSAVAGSRRCTGTRFPSTRPDPRRAGSPPNATSSLPPPPPPATLEVAMDTITRIPELPILIDPRPQARIADSISENTETHEGKTFLHPGTIIPRE